MNHACPHCGADLERTRPLSVPAAGERKVLPFRLDLACPNCGGHVRLNAHPWERRLRIADTTILFGSLAFWIAFDTKWFFVVALAVAGVTELAIWMLGRKYLHDWKRYVTAGPAAEFTGRSAESKGI